MTYLIHPVTHVVHHPACATLTRATTPMKPWTPDEVDRGERPDRPCGKCLVYGLPVEVQS